MTKSAQKLAKRVTFRFFKPQLQPKRTLQKRTQPNQPGTLKEEQKEQKKKQRQVIEEKCKADADDLHQKFTHWIKAPFRLDLKDDEKVRNEKSLEADIKSEMDKIRNFLVSEQAKLKALAEQRKSNLAALNVLKEGYSRLYSTHWSELQRLRGQLVVKKSDEEMEEFYKEQAEDRKKQEVAKEKQLAEERENDTGQRVKDMKAEEEERRKVVRFHRCINSWADWVFASSDCYE